MLERVDDDDDVEEAAITSAGAGTKEVSFFSGGLY